MMYAGTGFVWECSCLICCNLSLAMDDCHKNMIWGGVSETCWCRWINNNQLRWCFGGTDVLSLLVEVTFDGGCGWW
jgi:hypothetical protein